MNRNESITLYYREGASDKVYQASLEARVDGHVVAFAYGRRGSTLQTSTKTPTPVPYETAKLLYDRLVKEKTAKGYRAGEPGSGYANAELSGADTGVRCQLLNAIDHGDANKLVKTAGWCAQEKFDGRRMLLRRVGDEIIAINRRGLRTTAPEPILAAARALPGDFLLDGEAVGDRFHAFDVLECHGRDLRSVPLWQRLDVLTALLDRQYEDAIHWTYTARSRWEKADLLLALTETWKEGIVFKDLNAPYTAGRPASGGSQRKFKFFESATCLVAGHNAKRSVALALFEDGKQVTAGNVTIPNNVAVPAVGAVIEVRYLYALRESGSLYLPVYLGVRDDIDASECVTRQLKFKAAPEVAA